MANLEASGSLSLTQCVQKMYVVTYNSWICLSQILHSFLQLPPVLCSLLSVSLIHDDLLYAGLLPLFQELVLGNLSFLHSHLPGHQQLNSQASLESQPGQQFMTPTHHSKMEICILLVTSSKLALVEDFSTKAFASQTLETHSCLSHNSIVVQLD